MSSSSQSPPSSPFSDSAVTSTASSTRTIFTSRSLEGRLALITGGSRGIGAAIATNLASKGCSLILNYASASSAIPTTTLAHSLSKTHQIRAVPIRADISSHSGPTDLLTAAHAAFADPATGQLCIDILINNAGIAINAPLGKCTTEDFDAVFKINVLAPLMLTQAVLPHLPWDRTGRIVNLSSISSSAGFAGQGVYSASKAALEGLTRSWARELSERGTVNAVNPGPVKTDMWDGLTDDFRIDMAPWVRQAPMARVRKGWDEESVVEYSERLGGRPAYMSEIAGVVGMLCTDDAVWTTGQVICANGGMRMSS